MGRRRMEPGAKGASVSVTTCPHCDREVSATARFCSHCGTPLTAAQLSPAAPPPVQASPPAPAGVGAAAQAPVEPVRRPAKRHAWYRPRAIWWSNAVGVLFIAAVVLIGRQNIDSALTYVVLERTAGLISYILLTIAILAGVFSRPVGRPSAPSGCSSNGSIPWCSSAPR